MICVLCAAIAYLEDMIKHVTPDEQLWDCGAFCSLSSRTVALRPPQRTPFADVHSISPPSPSPGLFFSVDCVVYRRAFVSVRSWSS
mgnify:CR=1 FL=1